MLNIKKRLRMWAIVIALLLLVPLVLTLLGSGVDGDGWNWTPFDFIFMGILLFGSAAVFELISMKGKSLVYRAAVGVAVVTGVLLVWVNAAVGVIGSEGNPANAMYFGVLLIGFIGAAIARLEPRGMARTLFVVAFAHALVPVIAFFVWKPVFSPGVIQVFILNTFFVAAWVISGMLFREAHKNEFSRQVTGK